MLKYLFAAIALLFSAPVLASCCIDSNNGLEVGLGWRRDDMRWKLKDITSSYLYADALSKIHFKDLNYYTIHAKCHSVGCSYYFRASADYGQSDKGRAVEVFGLTTPIYDVGSVLIESNQKIKRRSEVYDFSAAIGYPFTPCGCKLVIAPLVGFSFHRQHLRAKGGESRYSASSFYRFDSESLSFTNTSESAFSVNSSNPFDFGSYDPFSNSSESDHLIANVLGLSIDKRVSVYRFTWYGPYVGVDIAYALDSCWSLFSQTEYHFLDNCHRKRKSLTGVYFVDDYHHKGWAYGFDQTVGATFDMGANYYFSIAADFKWWKGHSGSHDELHWKSVGVNAAMGYFY